MNSKDELQEKALQVVRNNYLLSRSLTLNMSMGSGKTLLAIKFLADILANNIVKVLIVVPKLSNKEAWLLEFDKYGYNDLLPNVEFSTYLSLPKKSTDYNFIFFDEVHNLTEKHLAWVSKSNSSSAFMLGLTGTPPKNKKSAAGVIIDTYLPIKFEYTVTDAIDDKLLNNCNIVIHRINLNTSRNLKLSTKSGRSWYTSEKDSYDFWCEKIDNAENYKQESFYRIQRMKAMMTYTSKEFYSKRLFDVLSMNEKCILFANTKEQADKLCENSYHSSNPLSEENLLKFKEGEIMQLSTVLQLNEGVNIPNLRQGIILHAYANEKKLSQRIGRLLRLNPDQSSTVHIFMYKDTADEQWVHQALQDFDPKNISYRDY